MMRIRNSDKNETQYHVLRKEYFELLMEKVLRNKTVRNSIIIVISVFMMGQTLITYISVLLMRDGQISCFSSGHSYLRVWICIVPFLQRLFCKLISNAQQNIPIITGFFSCSDDQFQCQILHFLFSLKFKEAKEVEENSPFFMELMLLTLNTPHTTTIYARKGNG